MMTFLVIYTIGMLLNTLVFLASFYFVSEDEDLSRKDLGFFMCPFVAFIIFIIAFVKYKIFPKKKKK